MERPEPIRILFVDDERNVLRALERIFLDDPYEIVTADSGAEGLRLLSESPHCFQVVVSDYRMPVMNGVEFLKEVCKSWPNTVRLVLSGYADAGAIVAAINEGQIYKFIPKPWNDEELRITIQNCLERYFLVQKNQALLEELAATNLVLEQKVRERTEDLEFRNKALEFAQTMLGDLPVGVIGVDENGLLVYCNALAADLLKASGLHNTGADILASKEQALYDIVAQTRQHKQLRTEIHLAGRLYRVTGRTIRFSGSEAVVLVLLEGS